MSRFLYWTDLHDEFWNKIPELPETIDSVDAILLGGDTSTQGRHIDIAKELFEKSGKPVILIRGNHEFYGAVVEDLIAEDRERISVLRASGCDIRLLDGDVTYVDETRIIGATLWTDLDLYPGYAKQTRDAVFQGLNDFSKIRMRGFEHLKVEQMLEMHWRDREAILSHLAGPHDGPTLVMTHHIPVKELIHPMRDIGAIGKRLVNAGFASDMGWQIKKYAIDAWVCGHSHDNRHACLHSDYGGIPFFTNARGYPREQADVAFDPGKILELNSHAPELMLD